jgi:hypothetical protein
VSETTAKIPTFLDRFMDGQATANDADDCVTAWHESGEEEKRPLAQYLGMTDEEYAVWTMDDRTLSDLAAARRPGGPSLVALMTERFRRMRAANDPMDRSSLHTMGYWLRARGIDTD